MVVTLQSIRLGLIGLGFYMLYVAVQELPKHPDWQDWLMFCAVVLNLIYLFAVGRLALLMKLWFDAKVTTTAAGIMGGDVVTSQDDSGHRLALRLTLREMAP
jgi:hypothetical protein